MLKIKFSFLYVCIYISMYIISILYVYYMYSIYIYTYIYIYIRIYIYIYNQTISFYLIKSSYTERKQVTWSNVSNTKSSSVAVTYLFCLKYKGKFCDSYTAKMWLLRQRFICLNVWKLYSAIFYYKVKFLNKKLCSMNWGWLKEIFW